MLLRCWLEECLLPFLVNRKVVKAGRIAAAIAVLHHLLSQSMQLINAVSGQPGQPVYS